jgi:hypothetical protein
VHDSSMIMGLGRTHRLFNHAMIVMSAHVTIVSMRATFLFKKCLDCLARRKIKKTGSMIDHP